MAEHQQPPPPAADPAPPGPQGQHGPHGAHREVAAPERKLTRSRRHKVAGGVCGGLGRYFDVDPIVFRVPFGVISVIGGLGLVAYGFAWLLIPADGERENEGRRLLSGRVEGSALTAILLALVGCGLFLTSVGTSSTSFALAVAVAVTGAAYWSHRHRSADAQPVEGAPAHHPTAALAVADAPPETRAPPAPPTPSWWRDPVGKDDGTGRRGTGYLWGPDDDPPEEERRNYGEWHQRLRESTKSCESIGGPVFLAAAAAAALGTSATWADHPLGSSLAVGLGCALAVFGLGLAISAFIGRAGGGTIFAIVLTAVLLAGASVLPKDISTDWDDRHWAPTATSELRDRYHLGSGRGVLDLTELRLRDGQTVRVSARVGAGELKALVPLDARVEVRLKVGVGSYDLPGGAGTDSGGGVDRSQRRTLEPSEGQRAGGTIELELDVGIGDVSLVRSLPGGPDSGRNGGPNGDASGDEGGDAGGDAGERQSPPPREYQEAAR